MNRQEEFLEIAQRCTDASVLIILKTMEEIHDLNQSIEIINNRPRGVPLFFDVKDKKWKSTKID